MFVVPLHKSACLFPPRFISYPRTETNMFPQNLNLTLLVEQQTQDNEWGNFAQRILESGGPTPRNGNKSDQAHPPIHPTKYTNSLQVSNLGPTPGGGYLYPLRHQKPLTRTFSASHQQLLNSSVFRVLLQAHCFSYHNFSVFSNILCLFLVSDI